MRFEFVHDTARRPVGAKATLTVSASAEQIRAHVLELSAKRDLAGLLRGTPLIKSLELRGDTLAIGMQFKVSFLSVKFGCRGNIVREGENTLRFVYLDGEPTHTWLRFDLSPGTQANESVIDIGVGFDLDSLGWVAKYFLKHHPEIRPGVFAGVAYAIADAIARGFPEVGV
jgi:hypothetical protein